MNDIRSFIRYLAPGITFVVELALLLILADPLAAPSWLTQLKEYANLGTVFGGVLALGGLGYLISGFHHNLYWSRLGARYAAIDSRDFIVRLQNMGRLKLKFQDGSNSDALVKLSAAGAWRVVTALWYTRRKSSERIKGATTRADSLSDLTHGAGSALVACVMSIVVAYFLAYKGFDQVCIYLMLPVSVFLPYMHWRSYRFTGKQTQGFAELVLFEELMSPLSEPPAVCWIRKEDLEEG